MSPRAQTFAEEMRSVRLSFGGHIKGNDPVDLEQVGKIAGPLDDTGRGR